MEATPVRALWPEGLIITAAVAYLWGITSLNLNPARASFAWRLLSIVGFLVTVAFVFLGAIWPSLYTLVAVPVIPAAFVFGFAIFRPMAVWPRTKLRWYLNLCIVLSGLMWVYQVFWELRA